MACKRMEDCHGIESVLCHSCLKNTMSLKNSVIQRFNERPVRQLLFGLILARRTGYGYHLILILSIIKVSIT